MVQMEKIRGLSARWEGDYIILTVPFGRDVDVKAAVEHTRPEDIWAVDPCLHPNADSYLYWETGQEQLVIIPP